MILSKIECPDCNNTGRDPKKMGICNPCQGTGKRRMTAAEYAAREIQAATPVKICSCGIPMENCGCG